MIICHEGRASHGRIPLTSHALDIPERLKAILPTAFIMINRSTEQYEIHDAAQPGSTLACILPFDKLDARTLHYVLKYRRERLAETAKEIDAYNERLERCAEAKHSDWAGCKMREAIQYLSAHSECDALPREMIYE